MKTIKNILAILLLATIPALAGELDGPHLTPSSVDSDRIQNGTIQAEDIDPTTSPTVSSITTTSRLGVACTGGSTSTIQVCGDGSIAGKLQIDGKLGIGTASPGAILDIKADVSISKIDEVFQVSSQNAVATMIMDGQGFLSIGDPGPASSRNRLSVDGKGVKTSGLGGTPFLATMVIASEDAASVDEGPALQFAGETGTGTGRHGFGAIKAAKEQTAAGFGGYLEFHTTKANSVQTAKMHITSSGTIKIGDSVNTSAVAPQARLEILASELEGVPLEALQVSSQNTTAIFVVRYDGNVGINDATPDAQLEILSNSVENGFVLAISSQNDTTGNLFNVLGNGLVGIGKTPTNAVLHILAQSDIEYAVQVTSPNATTEMFRIENNGHVEFSGVDPTLGTCTNGTIDTNSSDGLMVIDFAGANSSCVVNFAHTWTNTPVCFCTAKNAGNSSCELTADSTTSVTFAPVTGSYASGDDVHVRCLGMHAE